MNTRFPNVSEVCVPGFRARGLRPRPGMTSLHFKTLQTDPLPIGSNSRIVMEAPSKAEPVEPNASGVPESAPLDRQAIGAALGRMGLRRPGERLDCRPLDGGVSSEIWLV